MPNLNRHSVSSVITTHCSSPVLAGAVTLRFMTKQETKYIRATAVALATVSLFAAPQAIAEASKVKSHHSDRGRADTLLVECGSSEYRRTECRVNANFNVRDARVYRQKSSSDCIRGDDWGLHRNAIWVKDGCRAVFEVSNRQYARGYRDRDYGYGDRQGGYGRDGDWGRQVGYTQVNHRKARRAISLCSREANYRAWDRGLYSAQYRNLPEVRYGKQNRLRVEGVMTTLDDNGRNRTSTVCVIENGRVLRFRFD